jgi:hypothetical protein
MKFAIGAVVAAFCLIAAPLTASARGPYGSINVGNWKGGAYTNDQSGAFSLRRAPNMCCHDRRQGGMEPGFCA